MSAAADGFGELYDNVVQRIEDIKSDLEELRAAASGLLHSKSDEIYTHRESIVAFVSSEADRIDSYLEMASAAIQDAAGEFEIIERLF